MVDQVLIHVFPNDIKSYVVVQHHSFLSTINQTIEIIIDQIKSKKAEKKTNTTSCGLHWSVLFIH
jgi:hypothetical protein